MSQADDALRARTRLSLRAERAFGLNSVSSPQAGPLGPGPQETLIPLEITAETATDFPLFTTDEPTATFTAESLKTPEKTARLLAMDTGEVRGCTRCRLCETRTNTVFGEGSADAKIFFIGEGPGENEDLTGRPFVGRAGELLNKWIAAMGLQRELVYIANIVKCRPPQNREPAPDEVATCTPYLQRQLEIIRPQVIITLGRPAAQHMLQTKISMGKLRAQWHAWRGIKLMPTYHPAYVLRSYTYETRSAVWNDLQMVMRELGLPMPQKKNVE
jgi:uracil-DNA glycosylase family 4